MKPYIEICLPPIWRIPTDFSERAALSMVRRGRGAVVKVATLKDMEKKGLIVISGKEMASVQSLRIAMDDEYFANVGSPDADWPIRNDIASRFPQLVKVGEWVKAKRFRGAEYHVPKAYKSVINRMNPRVCWVNEMPDHVEIFSGPFNSEEVAIFEKAVAEQESRGKKVWLIHSRKSVSLGIEVRKEIKVNA